MLGTDSTQFLIQRKNPALSGMLHANEMQLLLFDPKVFARENAKETSQFFPTHPSGMERTLD
ncbi:hypothetical protein [Pelagibacterium halotolerans]|uniref:hypothetical protein n=1 Tax=Pelagibacterium halotolerans TaxID=531813 RepID=UPI0038508587